MPLDIGAGIIFGILTAQHYGLAFSFKFIGLSILFALLPDIDMLWYPVKRYLLPKTETFEHDHRSWPHYPALYLPATVLTYLLLGKVIAILFVLGVAFHLIHDTFGLGWGIKWLWPFSNQKFLFFPAGQRGVHDPHWIRRYYFQPSPIAFIEYGGLLAALLALYFAR